MSDNNVQEDFEVTKQAMKAYEAKLRGEMRSMTMVTKEEVEKAFAEYKAADAVFLAESKASHPLAWVAAIHAWDKYIKLKQEYEDGNKSTED